MHQVLPHRSKRRMPAPFMDLSWIFLFFYRVTAEFPCYGFLHVHGLLQLTVYSLGLDVLYP
jgi:hypothetical protein